VCLAAGHRDPRARPTRPSVHVVSMMRLEERLHAGLLLLELLKLSQYRPP
jgi:hypothetical protein